MHCPCVQPGWNGAKGQATEKSLPEQEPFDGEERVRKQWVGGEIGGEEGKQRVQTGLEKPGCEGKTDTGVARKEDKGRRTPGEGSGVRSPETEVEVQAGNRNCSLLLKRKRP